MPPQIGSGFTPAVCPVMKKLVQPSCAVVVWHPECSHAHQLAFRPATILPASIPLCSCARSCTCCAQFKQFQLYFCTVKGSRDEASIFVSSLLCAYLFGRRSENALKAAGLSLFSWSKGMNVFIHQGKPLDSTETVAEKSIMWLIVSSCPCIDPCRNLAVMRSIWIKQRNEVMSGVVDENAGPTSRFWAPILSSCLHTSAPADESSWRLHPAGSDKSANRPSSPLGPDTKTKAVVV